MNYSLAFGLVSNLPLAGSIHAATVVVDPATPLTNYRGGGEWNTNDYFEGWTATQISGATVTSGWLAGTASGTNPQVALLTFSGGPDLELAFHDYLDLRFQVPAVLPAAFPFIMAPRNTSGCCKPNHKPNLLSYNGKYRGDCL